MNFWRRVAAPELRRYSKTCYERCLHAGYCPPGLGINPPGAGSTVIIMANEKKKALIVVDVQNDFCPGGSLGVTNGDKVVAPLNKLMTEFLDRGEPVFKTRDWHPAQTKHFKAYGGTWPVHCVQGTRGAEFHTDLLDDPRITIISKGTDEGVDGYSGFDGTNLASLLREEKVEELWVGGLATDYCVKQTVLDGLREGFAVKALADVMRPVNEYPQDGREAIEEMRAGGAEIVGNESLAAGSS
jgi:nicotinamidase/pyrazinamidase